MVEFRENKDVRKPFLTTPDPRVYFPSESMEQARRSIARCLSRGEGIALALGTTGVGKTLLARVIESEFSVETLVSFASSPRRMDAKTLLRQFLYGLRQPARCSDETELRLVALEYLERARQNRCVLLVDDAHNLTLRAFDEIRLLIDHCAAVHMQLCVALFAANGLEDRLNIPALHPFQQRIVSRSYLESFNRAETCAYIDAELSRSGVDAIFTQKAKHEVARLSSGLPRVVAQLCDRALFLANESGISGRNVGITIDYPDVERAWNHLLSIPMEETSNHLPKNDSPTIEFGVLEDDEEESSSSNSPIEQPASNYSIDEKFNVATQPSAIAEFSTQINDEEETIKEDDVSVAQTDEEQATARRESAATNALDKPHSTWSQDSAATREQRRSEAKRAFWNDEESTIFVGASDDENRVDESKETTADVAEATVDAPQEYDDSISSEIDEDLDARLREKFGFDADERFGAADEEDEEFLEEEANELEEEGSDETPAPVRRYTESMLDAVSEGSYDLYKDGMKFEVRERSERSDQEVAFDKYVNNALKRRDNVAKENASAQPTSDDLDAPDPESVRAYDEQMATSPSRSPRYTLNPKRSTRVPIANGDDGAQEYYEFNGFQAEDAAKVAANAENNNDDVVSDEDASFTDQEYAQIVAAIHNENVVTEQVEAKTNDREPNASEIYLNELDLLEKEIAEEENLIRRIREVHNRLRSTVLGDNKARNDNYISDQTTNANPVEPSRSFQ